MAQDVVLAVDAEYTYTNPAINLLTLAMMKIFNTPTPIVWNTYQGYLKVRICLLIIVIDIKTISHQSSLYGIMCLD